MKIHSNILYTFLCFWSSLNFAFTQNLYFKRHEISEEKTQVQTVITVQERGAAVIAAENETLFQTNRLWEFTFVDTGFVHRFQTTYHLPSKQKYNQSFGADSLLCLLFDEDGTDVTLLVWNLNIGTLEAVNVKLPMRMTIKDLALCNADLYLAGEAKGRDVVIFFDTDTRLCKVLPSFYEPRLKVEKLLPNAPTGQMYILTSRENHDKNAWRVRVYNQGGFLHSDAPINDEDDYSPICFMPLGYDSTTVRLGGYYYHRNMDFPQGFWFQFINLADKQRNSYKRWPFAENKNFFAYKGQSGQKRMAEKLQRYKQDGEEYRLAERWILHKPCYGDSAFALIGDCYYKTHSNQSMSRPVVGTSSMPLTDYRMLDEYRYTRGNVTVFDKRANYLWDWTVEGNEHQSTKLEQNTFAALGRHGLSVLFLRDKKLCWQLVQDGKQVAGSEKKGQHLSLMYPDDEIMHTGEVYLSNWYSDIFLMGGSQRVRNSKTAGVEARRDVFFLYKVSVR